MTRNLIIVAVVVVVIGVIALLVVRRQRYVRSLRARGWTFESNPALEWVLDHHAPPFGLGFERSVDEGISGVTTAGVGFRVFEYATAEGGPRFNQRVASLALRRPLPELFVTTGKVRSGVGGRAVELDPRLQVNARDEAYARAVLGPPVLDAIAQFGQSGRPVDLSIDGAHLVSVGAPKNPDELQSYLDALAPVASAIDAAALDAYVTTPPPPGLGFYGHPDWLLVGRDDSLIGKYGLTTEGFGHETAKVIRGYNDGLPIEAFIHRWKTQRTETYTDSEGKTQTRTVTDQHAENVAAVITPFAFPALSVGGSGRGEKVAFESEQFNDRFKVRTADPRFAYDIIHPRTMEFLLAADPPGFWIDGTVVRFNLRSHDTVLIGFCADFVHEFFARVPSYVWKNLAITPPAFKDVW